jgi:MFS family permease
MADMARPAVRRQKRAAAARPARNPWLVLVIILTAVFMQLLDTTITMVGVPSIQNSPHSSFGEIQLVVAGYMLAFALALLLCSRLPKLRLDEAGPMVGGA